MTLRCRKTAGSPLMPPHLPLLALSLLLGLSAVWLPAAIGQEGSLSAGLTLAYDPDQDPGAQLPPPPALRRNPGDNSGSDPDFQPQLPRAGAGEDQGGPGQGAFQGRRGLRGGGFPGQSGSDGPGATFRRRMRGLEGGPGGGQFGGPGGGQFGGPGGPMGKRGPGGGPGGFMGAGGHKQLDLTRLGLTEEQKQKIQTMRQQTKAKAKDLRKDLMQRQLDLRNLAFSPTASDAQIRAARKELRKIQDQMDDLNLNDFLQIRGVLTSEQRQHLPEVAPPGGAGGGFGPGGGPQVASPDVPGAPGGLRKRQRVDAELQN